MVFFFVTMHYNNTKEMNKMDNLKKETITKSIRFESDLHENIQSMADESSRDFTKQVKFMLKEYIKITERK